MRKSLLILLCLAMSYILMAQETTKQKEVGIVFQNLDNFGLTYKTGTNKSLWRFNTLILSGSKSEQIADSIVNKNNNMGFGVKIGREYRKDIAEHLELRFGADLSFTYSQSKSDFDDKTIDNHDRLNERTNYQTGLNLVFGFNYALSDNIIIGAELLPGFSYSTGESTDKSYYTNSGEEIKSEISGFNYGLSNTSALISLVYRF